MYTTNIKHLVQSTDFVKVKNDLVESYIDWRTNVMNIKVTQESAERVIDEWLASGVNKIIHFTNDFKPSLIECHTSANGKVSECNVIYLERDAVQKLNSVPVGSEEFFVRALIKSLEYYNVEKRIKGVNLEL